MSGAVTCTGTGPPGAVYSGPGARRGYQPVGRLPTCRLTGKLPRPGVALPRPAQISRDEVGRATPRGFLGADRQRRRWPSCLHVMRTQTSRIGFICPRRGAIIVSQHEKNTKQKKKNLSKGDMEFITVQRGQLRQLQLFLITANFPLWHSGVGINDACNYLS